MRKSVANAVVPVGWPPLADVLTKLVATKIPIYACGAYSRAREVTETDLAECGAKFGNPTIFVSLVEWPTKSSLSSDGSVVATVRRAMGVDHELAHDEGNAMLTT